MSIPIVILNKNNGIPDVKIFIGQAHDATYESASWDSNKNNLKIYQGIIDEELYEIYSLGIDLDELEAGFLTWKINVFSASGGIGERYFVKVEIQQNSETVTNGVFTRSGELEGQKVVVGRCKFQIN